MSGKKKHMCPVFPDRPCPQGENMSEACSVRINGDFDPIKDFRDSIHYNVFVMEQNRFE